MSRERTICSPVRSLFLSISRREQRSPSVGVRREARSPAPPEGAAVQQRDEADEVRDGQRGAALAAYLGVGRTLVVRHERPTEMSVREFLAVLTPEIRRIVTGLRSVVRKAVPGASESVLWGSLSYHIPELGGRVKGAVCMITPRGAEVELGFIHGALLPDPERLLSGDQKAKRVLRVQSLRDLPRQAVVTLIRAAREVRPSAPSLRVAQRRPTMSCSGRGRRFAMEPRR
jgi:hypothetical protein